MSLMCKQCVLAVDSEFEQLMLGMMARRVSIY